MPDEPVIREPESGSWWIADPWTHKLQIGANAADRNVMLTRFYSQDRQERIELHLQQLDELLDALANVKAWLQRAIAQQSALDPDLPF